MAGLNLRRREWLVIIFGVMALGLIGAVPITQDLLKTYSRSSSQLKQAEVRLGKTRQIRKEVEAKRSGQKAILDRIRKRPARFNLWSFTDGCLRKLKLEKRASLERKRTLGSLDRVQMTLKGVNMEEVVDLLHAVSASDNLIVVQTLDHLRPARDGKGLECQITFITPKS